MTEPATISVASDGQIDSQVDGQIDSEKRTWSIGELAAEFGITSRTLRVYEEEGLLDPAREGTRRIYNERNRVRLRLILRGKRLGWSLSEVFRPLRFEPRGTGSAGTDAEQARAAARNPDRTAR